MLQRAKRPSSSQSHGALSSNSPWGCRLPTHSGMIVTFAPNCAQFPIDGLSRSTTGDTDSNNVPVRHSNPAAGPRRRGCARPCRGSLCPVLLPPFRPHVGTSLCHRHVSVVLLQITKAPLPLPLPLLFFQIVDSRPSPFCFDGRNRSPCCELLPLSIANCAA